MGIRGSFFEQVMVTILPIRNDRENFRGNLSSAFRSSVLFPLLVASARINHHSEGTRLNNEDGYLDKSVRAAMQQRNRQPLNITELATTIFDGLIVFLATDARRTFR